MGKALYRKYRSKSLQEVVGQDHITAILRRALDNGKVSHAYLFTGPRGVGKTSIARILAHEINQLPYTEDTTHLDIIEIDAASNNGVEDVRDLREKVHTAPVSAAKKVYIIDEVHMLSKPAFNALLKTLEEPPEHVVFILATTDVDKLPATIISRTQRFGFRPAAPQDVIKHLKSIAKKEHIKITDDALSLIADHGDGSFRDSISLLDQLSGLVAEGETIERELIEQTIGLAPHDEISALVDNLATSNTDYLQQLQKLLSNGTPASIIAEQTAKEIHARVLDTPQLLSYIDGLLEVSKSTHPDLKLLSVLRPQTITASASPTPSAKPKTVALASPAAEIHATIPELARKAVQKKPAEPKEAPIAAPVISDPKVPESFDWDAVLAHARKNYVALHSVMSKCTPELDGASLTLYTGNNFYKKKLDDPKYAATLSQCLQEAGGYELAIHTLPTVQPPQDSQNEAAFAIMGGGVEVAIEGNG